VATKTISVDLEAYERLRVAKLPGESFSQAIRRLLPAPVDLDAWFAELDRDPLDPRSEASVRAVVAGRARRSRKH
jgi:hypothetical protein